MYKLLIGLGFLALVGCGNAPQPPHDTPTNHQETTKNDTQDQGKQNKETQNLASPAPETPKTTANEPTAKLIQGEDGKLHIDWSQIDSKTAKTDPKTFAYPFAKDSTPVQNYAKEYNITPEQAQHSMLIAMASPEVLGKLLDQLDNNYLGHHLTDGGQMSLVITVKPSVAHSRFDYVFADTFAKGLVLPVVIEPKP